MNADQDMPLYLFAKAPLPGQVKTRMQPQLSEIQSAQLATMMIRQTVEKACQYWRGNVILTVSPSINHPLFHEIASNYSLQLETQIDGDLGRKMLHVLGKGIEQFGGAAVMGCDVPHITDEILLQSHSRLSEKQNVIGPSSDGGFYLLGLNRLETAVFKGIFEGVEWGGEQVIARVWENFHNRGIGLSRGRELRDIDHWDDLCWLGSQDQTYRVFVA